MHHPTQKAFGSGTGWCSRPPEWGGQTAEARLPGGAHRDIVFFFFFYYHHICMICMYELVYIINTNDVYEPSQYVRISIYK